MIGPLIPSHSSEIHGSGNFDCDLSRRILRDWKTGNGGSRSTDGLSGTHVETPGMERACDGRAGNRSVGHGTAPMWATVVHGIDGSLEFVEGDLPSIDRNGNARAAIFKVNWFVDQMSGQEKLLMLKCWIRKYQVDLVELFPYRSFFPI